MKEFIEKLISRLEDTRWTTIFDTQCIFENDKLDKCIEIVNQLAEEYKLLENIEQLNNEWIPCSERLPKSGVEDWVLVQIEETDSGFRWIPRIAELRRDMWYLIDTEYPLENTFKVAAWQPLPAPYKEGE